MKYDFTTIIDRQGKDALAVEAAPFPGAEVKEGFDKIPMWVADMKLYLQSMIIRTIFTATLFSIVSALWMV